MTTDMTLDGARAAFEAQPTAETAATYMRVASQYQDDGMIEVATAAAVARETEPYRNPERIRIVCRNCGSTNCGRDASAIWVEDEQTWDLASVHDSSWCDDCGEDDPGLDEEPIKT